MHSQEKNLATKLFKTGQKNNIEIFENNFPWHYHHKIFDSIHFCKFSAGLEIKNVLTHSYFKDFHDLIKIIFFVIIS